MDEYLINNLLAHPNNYIYYICVKLKLTTGVVNYYVLRFHRARLLYLLLVELSFAIRLREGGRERKGKCEFPYGMQKKMSCSY